MKDVQRKGGFIKMEDVENNDGLQVYIDNDTLQELDSNKTLTVDGKETNFYGKKIARLTLIKN